MPADRLPPLSLRPKGHAFAREVIALLRADGRWSDATSIAESEFRDTPEVAAHIKAAVAPLTTTDDTALNVWPAATEFFESIRPMTALYRMAGMRRVPFGATIPRQTSNAVVSWIGQKLAKPAARMSFDSLSLPLTKASAIVAFSDELIMLSRPGIEDVVRQELQAAMSYFLDESAFDPTQAGTAASPAALTYNATSYSSAGTAAANIASDLGKLMEALRTAGCAFRRPYFIMHPRSCVFLATLRTSADVHVYPTVTAAGGTLYGIPILATPALGIDTGADTRVCLIDASEVVLADGGVRLDASREASLQLSDAPSDNAAQETSLWQSNLRAIKIEHFVGWQIARAGCVAVLQDVAW